MEYDLQQGEGFLLFDLIFFVQGYFQFSVPNLALIDCCQVQPHPGLSRRDKVCRCRRNQMTGMVSKLEIENRCVAAGLRRVFNPADIRHREAVSNGPGALCGLRGLPP